MEVCAEETAELPLLLSVLSVAGVRVLDTPALHVAAIVARLENREAGLVGRVAVRSRRDRMR